MSVRSWVWCLWASLLLVVGACSDEAGSDVGRIVEGEDAGQGDAGDSDQPCDGECPPESCVGGVCADADAGVGDGGGQGACAGDEDCPPREICDDASDPPACRPGCRVDDDCGDGARCDPERFECLQGCVVDEDCGPAESCLDGACVPATCAQDADCAPDQFCNVSLEQCTPGCRERGCEEGSYCDLDSRQCLEGCEDSDACAPNELCEILNTDEGPRRRCVREACTGDDACADDEYCDFDEETLRNRCFEGCRLFPDNCPGDAICNPELHQCEDPECVADDQCAPGEICERGLCELGCRDDAQCPEGQVCAFDGQGFICQTPMGCEGDDDCPEGERCDRDSGLCLVDMPGCDGDDDCLAGEFCDDAQTPPACVAGCRPGGCPLGQRCDLQTRLCQDGCAEDAQCPMGQVCQDNQCTEGCRDADECPVGEVCDVVLVMGQPRNRCVPPLCQSDEDCGPETYCSPQGPFDRNACLPGCRTRPDNCADTEICNVLTRQCQLFICADDDQCGPGAICEAQNCLPGCRADEDCAQGQLCDVNARQCGCGSDGDCAPGQICEEGACVEPCFEDFACPIGQICNQQTGRCQNGCIDDADCGDFQGLECDPILRECLGRRCAEDLDCETFQFCDLEGGQGRCEEGCREGGCGFDRFCDTQTRVCEDGCLLDDDCPFGSFCDQDSRVCLLGCRGDDECPFGLTCQDVIVDEVLERQCLETPCQSDAECLPEDYCGFDQERQVNACVLGCRVEPDNCFEGSACNPQTHICEFETCASDAECGDGQVCFNDGFLAFCRVGCRNDNQCAPGQFCTDFSLRCTCFDNEDCGSQEVCQYGECGAPCNQDSDCPFDGMACVQETGQCLFTCARDNDCDVDFGERCVGNLCVAGSCAIDTDCAPFQYCDTDQNPSECADGCRLGECGFENHCEPDTRLCEAGCRVSEDCGEGFNCGEDFTCIQGCGGDDECPPGQSCEVIDNEGDPVAICIPSRCDRDQDCGEFEYCGLDIGLNENVCMSGCRPQPDNCPPRRECAPDIRVCVPLSCNNDNDCVEGEICFEGAFGNNCLVGCRSDDDCGGGQECNPDFLLCTCAGADDCPVAGQGCANDGFCSLGCQSDDECFFPATCNLERQICEDGF